MKGVRKKKGSKFFWPTPVRVHASLIPVSQKSHPSSSTVCAQAPALWRVLWFGLDPPLVSRLGVLWATGEEKCSALAVTDGTQHIVPVPNNTLHFFFPFMGCLHLRECCWQGQFVCIAASWSVAQSVCSLPGSPGTAWSWEQPSVHKQTCKCKWRASRSHCISPLSTPLNKFPLHCGVEEQIWAGLESDVPQTPTGIQRRGYN